MLDYFLTIAIMFCIYALLALALQLNLGYTGLINLAITGFFAIAAYSYAILTINNVPWLFAFIFSAILTTFAAIVVSFLSKNMKGDFFAIASLAFSLLVYTFVLNVDFLTKGPFGIAGIPKPEIFSIKLSKKLDFFLFSFLVTLISYAITAKLLNSRFGILLQAIRDNELAAKALGKNTSKAKTYSLVIAALLVSVAALLYTSFFSYIHPNNFHFLTVITLLLIVLLAGLATIKGTVVATAIVILIPELLRFFVFEGFANQGALRQMLFALILLIIVVYYPKGLFGRADLP